MYKTFSDIQGFCMEFNALLKKDKLFNKANIVVGIAPTYVGIIPFGSCNKTPTLTMAQNVNAEVNGAYTGEISFNMLKELNVKTVLVGHSEVRSHLNESDSVINKKVLTLLKEGMTPVLCVGETLQEFEANKTIEVLNQQLHSDLANIDLSNVENLVIAYEPIWAIGTGKTATNDIIEKTFVEIKKILKTILGSNIDKVSLLYGGSVNDKNAPEILRVKNVDGVLVGGASLDAKKFYSIIKSVPEYSQAKVK
jgi:triosephosphate isomerase